MSLQNPQTIDEVIEKLMITCISANMELMREMAGAGSLDHLKEAQQEYHDLLVDAKEQAKELILNMCALPQSIQEALNSGDGVYRP